MEEPLDNKTEDANAACAVVQSEIEVTEPPAEDLEENKNLEIGDPTIDISANEANTSDTSSITSFDKNSVKETEKLEVDSQDTSLETENLYLDKTISILQCKNISLNELKQSLLKQIEKEKAEILILKEQLPSKYLNSVPVYTDANCASLDEIMYLLHKENQILQIKKINLVRQIMEQQEACIDLQSNLDALLKNKSAA